LYINIRTLDGILTGFHEHGLLGKSFYLHRLLVKLDKCNVVAAYVCTDFDGDLKVDGIEVQELRFFNYG
jgi:hypothetical protein